MKDERVEDTRLAKAIRTLQNEVDEKMALLEELRKSHDIEDIDYYKYLKTQAWENLRQQIFRRDHFRCVVCGEPKNLSVHHITYENLGVEKTSDLVTLCPKCHKKVHDGDPVSHQIQERKKKIDELLTQLNAEIELFCKKQKQFEIDKFMDCLTRKLFGYAFALGEDYFKLDEKYKLDPLYLNFSLWDFVKHFNSGKPIEEYEWHRTLPFDLRDLAQAVPDWEDKELMIFEYKKLLGMVCFPTAQAYFGDEVKKTEIPRHKEKYELYCDLCYGLRSEI